MCNNPIALGDRVKARFHAAEVIDNEPAYLNGTVVALHNLHVDVDFPGLGILRVRKTALTCGGPNMWTTNINTTGMSA
jgi:hypothetical protein